MFIYDLHHAQFKVGKVMGTLEESFKTGKPVDKFQPAESGWSISVFAYDDFRGTFEFGLRVIHLIPVHKHDYISVLFNRT